MNLIKDKKIKLFLGFIQRYNHKKYWRMRSKVIDPTYKSKIIKFWYLYKIKRMDAFNNASMGTGYNSGATFKTPPLLPHGLNGIIIGHD